MFTLDKVKKIFMKVERLLLKTSVALAILLIIGQVLLQIPTIRMIITSVDLLEGYPYQR